MREPKASHLTATYAVIVVLLSQAFHCPASAESDTTTKLTQQIAQMELEMKLAYLIVERARCEAKVARAKADKEKAEAEQMGAKLAKLRFSKELEELDKSSSQSKK